MRWIAYVGASLAAGTIVIGCLLSLQVVAVVAGTTLGVVLLDVVRVRQRASVPVVTGHAR